MIESVVNLRAKVPHYLEAHSDTLNITTKSQDLHLSCRIEIEDKNGVGLSVFISAHQWLKTPLQGSQHKISVIP